MHNIELINLKFSNVLSYGNTVNEINFMDGVSWVKGANGAGKSAILEALTFAFFGTPYRKINKGELKNTSNKSKLRVELKFKRTDSKGTHEYIIIREMVKSGTSTTEFIKDGVEESKEAGFSQKYFESDVMGFNRNIWENIISLNTIQSEPFIDMDSTKRRSLIESILTLQIDKYKDLNKKALKESQTKLESAKSDVVKYLKDKDEVSNIIVTMSDEREDDIKKLENEIIELQQQINNFNTNIEDLNNKKELLVKQGVELSEGLKKFSTLDNDIKVTNNMINVINQIFQLETKLIDVNNIVKNTELIYKNVKEIYDNTPAFDSKKWDELTLNRKKLESSKTKIYADMSIHKNDMNKIEAKVKELKVGVPCGTCGKPSTDEDINKIKNSYGVEWKTSSKQFKELEKEYNTSELELASISKSIEDMSLDKDKYHEISKKFDEAKRNYDSAIDLSKTYSGNILELKSKLIENHIHPSTTVDLLNEKLQQFDLITTERNELNSLINIKRNEVSIIINDIKNINTNIQSLNSRILSINDNINKKKDANTVDSISMMKDRLHGIILDYDRANDRVKNYSDEVAICKYIEGMYDDNGIKKIILGIFVPNLNKTIAHNLQLFNLPFMIDFDDSMQFRFNSLQGLAPVYNALSQGQKRKLNFAIAMAFRDFVTTIADFRINILFLDEVLDISTDEEALDHMIQLLRNKVSEIGGIYLMTHRGENFQEYFDNCIEVTNDGTYSSLKQFVM